MLTVDDVVRETILDFISSGELFTALDVSNKVKNSLPFARHREVRDLVRNSFRSDIEPAGYVRTPIQVTLADGSAVEALLYHPASDSWDLDSKYDNQKRSAAPAQAKSVPSNPAPVFVPIAASAPAPVVTTVVPSAPASSPTAHALWDQMFSSQPSLFPRK